MLNLNSVMIGSMQPKVMADFYTKILGKAPDMVEGNWSGWSVGSSFLSVGEHSEMSGPAKDPGRIMFNFETTEMLKVITNDWLQRAPHQLKNHIKWEECGLPLFLIQIRIFFNS